MDEDERRKMAADVYLKEYEKLRDEVQSNLNAETSVLQFATALFTALVAALWAADKAQASSSTGNQVEPYLLAFAPLIFVGLWVALLHKQGNSTRIAHYIGKYLRERLRDLGVERPLEWDFWKQELSTEMTRRHGWLADLAGRWVIGHGGRLLILVVAPFGFCIARFSTLGHDVPHPWVLAVLCWALAAACVGLSLWYRQVAYRGAGDYCRWRKDLEGLE